ncbi:MAG: AraC family transcriptional regulator [Lachnospiraceae bacterium]|nr:AraC family transcriptional regulator [Lachnospiraceae bacterium]
MRTVKKTSVEIKTMERMEEILEYLITHLDEELDIDKIAEVFDYNSRYFARIFREYFGVPFHKYVVRLRLRQSAQIILWKRTIKGHWNEFGYMNKSSYSKAFRQEFGKSPEHFLKEETEVPWMPVREKLFGRPVSMYKETIQEFSAAGKAMPKIHMNGFKIKEQLGYWLKKPDSEQETAPEIGFWYCAKESGRPELFYIKGRPIGEHDTPSMEENLHLLTIPGGTYAVFSMPFTGSNEEKQFTVELLSRYIFNEWKLINHVNVDGNGMVYETYRDDKVFIHIPVLQPENLFVEGSSRGTGAWTDYIDKHIREDITVASVAEWAGYSERMFSQVFRLYYDMSPEAYIQKKRLYLSARGLKRSTSVDMIARRYHFESLEDFREKFLTEFGVYPEEAGTLSFQSVDLKSFYQKNKKNVHLSFRNESPIRFIAVPVSKRENFMDAEDIPEQAARHFLEDAPVFLGTEYAGAGEKLAIWDEIPDSESGEMLYEYVVGPKVEKRPEMNYLPLEVKSYELNGGWYAVFESENEDDTTDLAANFRFLTRCAFYGWLQENLYRYDGRRLTYVKLKGKKLYFYVPLIN